ncbi:STAS domain-containing protein [Microbispora sp. ATCC PTA-5024]|uniref:STAS domain-containing protein n=1 Tax=Microbispora sp. ATCC PTA-5024 TaxID=316330 RepID=UPI0003DCD404|nr:STAS domain-containing protein [Microbispora sp. ATCC PTA-5024]ETK34774.1 hypothetical protein MPTA5024_17865 [Microbispora sp. ATCC PTA-5024]
MLALTPLGGDTTMPDQMDPTQRFAMSVRVQEDVVVASASGDLDYNHAAQFRERLTEARDALTPLALVLDLSAVTFCDSMGVGALAVLLNQSREHGVSLVLSALPTHLERVLTLTGLRPAFRVEPTVDDAVSAVRAHRSPPV